MLAAIEEQVRWGTGGAPVCESAATMSVFLPYRRETRTLNRLLVIYKSNCDSLDEKSMSCKHFFTKVVRLVTKVDATWCIITKVDATGFKPALHRIRIA